MNNLFLLLLYGLLTCVPSPTKAIKSSMYNPPWKHCINTLHAEWRWQELASPGFPNGIERQTHCSWIILATPPNRIKLAFSTLNLTGAINHCFSQYVEFWDIPTATSVAKLCGSKRPGDYVSLSGEVRVDLKADSADSIHSGFFLKFKLTKESSGYKQDFEFLENSAGLQAERVNPIVSGVPNIKPRKKSTGKIDLTGIKKQRDQATNRVYKQVYTQRRVPQPPKSKQPPSNKNQIIIVDEEKPVTFQLWVIILISVGGFLFFVLIAVLCWLSFEGPKRSFKLLQWFLKFCFCRQRKHQQKQPPMNIGINAELPFQKNLHLPSALTNYQYYPYYSETMSYSSSDPLQNYSSPKRETTRSEQDKPRCKKRKAPPVPHFAQTNFFNKTPTNGRLSHKCFVTKNSRGQTSTAKDTKKQVPTLKRKLSPWEKEEIRNGRLKTYNI